MAADTKYFLRRSQTEAVQSIAAADVRVAAVHQELCLLYTSRAIAGMIARVARR